jgi:hypothetical protein
MPSNDANVFLIHDTSGGGCWRKVKQGDERRFPKGVCVTDGLVVAMGVRD